MTISLTTGVDCAQTEMAGMESSAMTAAVMRQEWNSPPLDCTGLYVHTFAFNYASVMLHTQVYESAGDSPLCAFESLLNQIPREKIKR
jgi:hypothetical protein